MQEKRGKSRIKRLKYWYERSRRDDWIERLNESMNYIEDTLEELDYTEAAKCACCSVYHFQRMFAYMAGGAAL